MNKLETIGLAVVALIAHARLGPEPVGELLGTALLVLAVGAIYLALRGVVSRARRIRRAGG